MGGYTAAAALAVQALQVLLMSLQDNLALESSLCPVSASIDSVVANGPYDIIIVGGGTAGSVLVHELAVKTTKKILLIEGGYNCPPLESMYPGLFTLLPDSRYDRQYDMHDDGYSCQNIKKSGYITAGNVLGGSSTLDHMMYISPFANDYNSWATAANDSSWSFPELAKFFAKVENIQDVGVLEQNATEHGTSGPVILTKQESTASVMKMIDAFVEMGSTYISDAIGACNVYFPLLNIGNACNKRRQSGVVSYISKILDKENVKIITNATVTKVNFEGTTATGVQVTVDGSSYTVNACQVILSAGAIGSPHLLMVSGVGDEDMLTKNNIPVVVNNVEVGQNLMDHAVVVMAYGMTNGTITSSSLTPSMWPADMVTNYAGPTCNETATSQQIVSAFPANSSGLLQLCGMVFKYSNSICDAMYESGANGSFFVIDNLLNPLSRGSISLTSDSIFDQPIIKSNIMNNYADVESLAESAMAFNKFTKTNVFEDMGATLADVGVCSDLDKDTIEFWECYALQMSSSLWHFCGTCAIGTVLDSHLRVKGTTNLRVIDASVFPKIPSANPLATVLAVATKGADTLIQDLQDC